MEGDLQGVLTEYAKQIKQKGAAYAHRRVFFTPKKE